MGQFFEAAKADDVPVGEMKLVEVDDRLVILFRVAEDEFCCIDDVCTHDGGTLSDGELKGDEIMCPRHGARFNLCTGKALCMPATQDTATHEVKVDRDTVFVRISAG